MSLYKSNLQHLPQRLPIRLRWKENKVVRAVFIRGDCGDLYLQMKEDEKPKHIRHGWNSYLKHHVPWSESNYNPVSPRHLSELDLLDLMIYEDSGRLDGQTEPSLKTILTTYAPTCIQLLKSAPHEPEPVIPQERINQERTLLLGLTSVPQTIDVGHFGAFLKATLMPDGTFTYGSRKGLNSFQLLHIFRMECDPLFYRVESLLTWTSSLDLLYVEGGSWGSSLSNRVKEKVVVPAKVEAPAPKVEPPPKVELCLSVLLKTLEERESVLKARLVTLQNTERERLAAIQEASGRIAALEADIARLEKTLA